MTFIKTNERLPYAAVAKTLWERPSSHSRDDKHRMALLSYVISNVSLESDAERSGTHKSIDVTTVTASLGHPTTIRQQLLTQQTTIQQLMIHQPTIHRDNSSHTGQPSTDTTHHKRANHPPTQLITCGPTTH